jgi:RNA polymerase sigma factor for flagellar operon FliA
VAVSPDELELWARLRGQACREAHEALFFRYAPWSRAVARDVYRRVRLPQLDWSDYTHNASIGLLEAIGRYDATRGIDFPAYARPRVRGAVFNGLRVFLDDSRGGGIMERRRERVESLDAAAAADDPLGHLVELVTGLAAGLMIESEGITDGTPSHTDPTAHVERHQLQELARSSLQVMNEQERRVVQLHYFQHLPFVEIAALLGLTKGRISQVHKAAMGKAAAYIAGQGYRAHEL